MRLAGLMKTVSPMGSARHLQQTSLVCRGRRKQKGIQPRPAGRAHQEGGARRTDQMRRAAIRRKSPTNPSHLCPHQSAGQAQNSPDTCRGRFDRQGHSPAVVAPGRHGSTGPGRTGVSPPSVARRPDHYTPVWLDTLGLADHVSHGVDHVVNAFPLERVHRLQAHRIAVLLHAFGGVLGD
jgi:hypothetical protein